MINIPAAFAATVLGYKAGTFRGRLAMRKYIKVQDDAARLRQQAQAL